MVIAVDRDDIDFGVARSKCHCAIARSIARAFPDARRINVDSDAGTISYTDIADRQRYVYQIPTSVSNWIARWDRGEPVRRLRFRLEVGTTKPMKARPVASVGRGPQTKKKTVTRAASPYRTLRQPVTVG